MWNPEQHRRAAKGHGLRYPSDLTNAEWAFVEAMIPPGRRGDRPRNVNLSGVLNATVYVLSTACQCNVVPGIWRRDGTLAASLSIRGLDGMAHRSLKS